MMLGYLLGSMRCYGGEGWRWGTRAPWFYPCIDPLEEMLKRAVGALPESEELLAQYLIVMVKRLN